LGAPFRPLSLPLSLSLSFILDVDYRLIELLTNNFGRTKLKINYIWGTRETRLNTTSVDIPTGIRIFIRVERFREICVNPKCVSLERTGRESCVTSRLVDVVIFIELDCVKRKVGL
jgi:hypothetical protein